MKTEYDFLPPSILLSGILISAIIFYGFGIDFLQKIFSIVGSLSLGIALAAYLYKKNQDRTTAAIEQISFFRKEIILEWDKISKKIREKNKNYPFSRIEIEIPTIEFMRKKYSRNFESQSALFLNDLTKSEQDIETLWKDPELLDSQIRLFNILEEFSLMVQHFKTTHHPALNSIRSAFVEIIERNAAALIIMRVVVVGSPIYSVTLSLYNSWRREVHRQTGLNLIKTLHKHGFITKKQRDNILSKNRKVIEK